MIRSYFKIALRSLVKQFSYTAINIAGLGIGLASFILILLFIRYHIGFDQHIPERDLLYRVVQIQQAEGVGEQHVAVNMGPLAPRLKSDLPEVTDAVRVMHWGTMAIKIGDTYFSQDNVAWTDPSVFRLFGIKLTEGDTATALNDIHSVVLSVSTANKLFGKSEGLIGQTINFNNEEGYVITGIMEDQPRDAHIWMDVLVSFSSAELQYPWLREWGSNSMAVYVKLLPTAKHQEVTEKINLGIQEFVKKSAFTNPPKMYLQAVNDIHLRSTHIKFQMNFNQGDQRTILIFSIIAVLIIAIASINFINLAIARSVKRAKEVGVRKVLGANRMNLVYQFMGESVIITFFAILLALIIVELSLPEFNRMLDTELKLNLLHDISMNLSLVVIWLFVSLFSGIYPALFMSRYKAVDVLKGSKGQRSSLGNFLGKGLVVFQFSVTILLIFLVTVSYRQFDFALRKDLGFNGNNVTGLLLQGGEPERKATLLKDAIVKLPKVKGVAAASFVNGVAGNQSTIFLDDTTETKVMVRFGYVDENFFPLMDIPITQGRNFSKDYPNDIHESVILNEAAVKFLGWDEPIGKRFRPFGMDTLSKRTVIGVIKDYHYYSVHSKIEPAAYIILPESFGVVCVKAAENAEKEVEQLVEKTWRELFPTTPYESISVTAYIEKQYRDDRNSMQLYSLFSLLSVLISAMGLYGLSSLRVEQRTKEIGIRKVLGGSSNQILQLIGKEFIVLVVFAGMIAIPLGYLFSSQLLSSFAYTISLGISEAIIALLVAVLVAAFTIVFHARRAAAFNPVEALKYE